MCNFVSGKSGILRQFTDRIRRTSTWTDAGDAQHERVHSCQQFEIGRLAVTGGRPARR